ncbi:histidinol dehydrogenase [Clostridiaceae bacterium AM27-36LB]|nr:histidinol dehydrogenase [Clostridiales bacterium AM23-16LB]RHR45315.1 histidinol dehydrogenase [Clostridiaceae bacterium AF18-31LB]RHT83804.1 histidinol dehydrogenase [Clostridiaceae bacterium AM27-36LB]
MRIVTLSKESRQNLLDSLLKRSPGNYGQYQDTVQEIVDRVKTKGDQALFELTRKFDWEGIDASNVKVTEAEVQEAYDTIDPQLVETIRKSLKNIREYHEKQKQYSWFDTTPEGTMLGQKVTPLASAGVYVPGGKAVYPSSVLMNIVPAKIAGVAHVVMCTPCNKEGKVNPAVLVAAKEAGADEVYKVGGAQAIAAMAFGTESIPKVDKITGPGNIFVALAKKAVSGFVSIDSIAGPSEILVLADETANPRYVAADLLSQAEHDEMASAILVTTSKELAEKVSEEVDAFVKILSRKEIISKSLDNYGYILVAETLEDAIETVDLIASEHLEIVTKNPFEVMMKVKNAGAIFLGEYSSEPLGDYFAGPNHILPTNGTARFFSPVSVDDFIKKSSIIYYSREALQRVHKDIEYFAKAEQLTAHANSIAVRFEDEN